MTRFHSSFIALFSKVSCKLPGVFFWNQVEENYFANMQFFQGRGCGGASITCHTSSLCLSSFFSCRTGGDTFGPSTGLTQQRAATPGAQVRSSKAHSGNICRSEVPASTHLCSLDVRQRASGDLEVQLLYIEKPELAIL